MSRWPVVQALGRLGDHGWRLPVAVIGLPWLVSKRWSGQNEGVGVIIHGDATVGSHPRHAGGWRVRLVAGGPGHAAGRLSAVRAAPSHAVRATRSVLAASAMTAQTGGLVVLPVPDAGKALAYGHCGLPNGVPLLTPVVGLEGDLVGLEDGDLWINGVCYDSVGSLVVSRAPSAVTTDGVKAGPSGQAAAGARPAAHPSARRSPARDAWPLP
jgi:hypothetical protein